MIARGDPLVSFTNPEIAVTMLPNIITMKTCGKYLRGSVRHHAHNVRHRVQQRRVMASSWYRYECRTPATQR